MLAVLFPLCVGGPVALRVGWQRSPILIALGWAALAVAALLLAWEEGAWGLAAGAGIAMLTALALLAQAALTTQAPNRAVAERVPARLPQEAIDWRDVLGRVGVFLVVVILDLGASLLFAWSVQRALFHAGVDEADTTALALFLQPLLWLALASWQMMQGHLKVMLPPPFALIVLGGILWLGA